MAQHFEPDFPATWRDLIRLPGWWFEEPSALVRVVRRGPRFAASVYPRPEQSWFTGLRWEWHPTARPVLGLYRTVAAARQAACDYVSLRWSPRLCEVRDIDRVRAELAEQRQAAGTD